MKSEASYHQQRLWFIDKFEKGNVYQHAPVYHNVPLLLRLRKPADVPALEQAIGQVLHRHEALRTIFVEEGNTPYQQILAAAACSVELLSFEGSEQERTAFAIDIALQPFAFTNHLLVRAALIDTPGLQQLLVITIHSALVDKSSVYLLVKELDTIYQACLDQATPELPLPAIQYPAFAAWQKSFPAATIDTLMSYWKRVLHGKLAPVELPLDRPRALIHVYKPAQEYFSIPASCAHAIEACCAQEHLTPQSFLLAAFKILLHRYSGTDEIVTGIAGKNRTRPELERTIGPLANLLTIRSFIDDRETLADLARKLDRQTHQAHQFQALPFDKLVKELAPEKDMARTALFDILFHYEDENFTAPVSNLAALEWTDTNLGWGKYDLNLSVKKTAGDWACILAYNADYFNASTIRRFAGHFRELLQHAVAESSAAIPQLRFLPEREKQLLLTSFNDPAIGYPADCTIIDLFHGQVSRVPERIAVTCNDTRMTYAELDAKAAQLATALIKRGAGPGSIVGLALPHTSQMIIGIIGTLKAGAAYLPLDESYPPARVAYMLKDSGCDLVVATPDYTNTAIDKETAILLGRDTDGEEAGSVIHAAKPDHLAYIIYTSGTTGQPKGAMITNRNLVRLFFNDKCLFDFNETDVWSLFHSFCFDFSVWEMYGALLFGGEVVVVPRLVARDTPAFMDLLVRHRVTVLNQTPSAFYNLCGLIGPDRPDLAIRYVIFGGEALNCTRLKTWHALYPGTQLINMYGITETTVHVTYKAITADDIEKGLNNIGKPIPTTTLYILDANQQPAPVGVPGEIYVGGKGVGKGYIGKPGLTATKFIPDPFQPGEYLYRSGDAGRWLATGEVVYLGRIDQQVQLRGFRIETGEIEARLLSFPGMKETVVILREDDQHQYLCAYYVAAFEYERKDLRSWLEKDLPEYMLPSYFVRLDRIPLTHNGKTNRAELPMPVITLTAQKDAPETELESLLVHIFEQVLGVKNLGARDNFFHLGGDSINTIQVVSRLQQQGYELRIQDIFRNPTPRELAGAVKKKTSEVSQEQLTGKVGLLPAQQGFLRQPEAGRHHFNQSISLQLEGADHEAMVKAVFDKLVQQHDALRMVFRADGEAIVQECLPQLPVTVEKVMIAGDAMAQVIKEKADAAQAGFDLATGPLLKLLLFESIQESRLLIIIHHLVVDGVSWRILLEDIDTLVRQYQSGQPLVLPSRTASVQQWRQDLDRYKQGKAFRKAVHYWERAAQVSVSRLPRDTEAGFSCNADTDTITFRLSERATQQLVSAAHQAYGTNTQDILLAAFASALHAAFGMRRSAIMLEGHGREAFEEASDISRTVGWFTSFYPVVLAVPASGAPGELLREVKESIRRIPNHGFDYTLRKDDAATAAGTEQDAEILFNFLGQFDAAAAERAFKVGGYTGKEADPARKRMFALEVSGIIANHRLQLRLSYSRKEYREETMLKLSGACEKALEELISHCSSRTTLLKSPSDFTYKELSIPDVDALQKEQPVIDIYPLSPMQEGMLFHSLLDPGQATYLVQFSYQVEGDIAIAGMESAFGGVIGRYDVLRSVMLYEGQERPLQVVRAAQPGGFVFRDVTAEVKKEDRTTVVDRYRQQDRDRGFDLQKDILVRLTILQTGLHSYQFIWSYHHIVMDGWCTGILIKEFTQLYEAARTGATVALPPVTPFVRYIEWLEQQDKEEAKQFWKQYLDGLEEPGVLPKNVWGGKNDFGKGFREEPMTIPAATVTRLNALASQAGVTLNTVMQAAWGILLSRYNNSNDVLFGAVVSGRTADIGGIETMIGLFINAMPVRVRLSEGATVTELLHRVQQQSMESLKYEYYPLADIQAETRQGSGLINHILAFENFPSVQGVEGKYKVLDVAVSEQTNYDLNVVILPGETMVIKFLYNAGAYSQQAIDSLKQHLAGVLNNIAADANRLVTAIGMLAPEEHRLLTAGFNDTDKEYDRDTVIHRLFEEQAARTPDATALICEDQTITYRELNEKANHLALQLLGDDGKGQAVAVLMNRSVEMVITLFAILKAGGTYIPLEPYLPDGRVKRLLRSLGCKKLVIDNSQQERMISLSAGLPELETIYCFDAEEASGLIQPVIPGNEACNPSTGVTADDIAYIIFTSGSSGTPKGVIIKHRPVINLIEWVNRTYGISGADRVLFISSVSFDLSVYDIFGLLAGGGSVQIMPGNDINDAAKLLQSIYRYGITYWDSAPAALQQLVPWMENNAEAGSKHCFRLVFLSGDWIPLSLPDNVKKTFAGAQVIALGGATEATVWSNFFTTGAINPDWKSIPYGKPMQNASYYVLDKDLQPCPIGVRGDLYIGGECIATGYVNETELTANRFIDNPFRRGEKMYATGDTACWFADGNIEFMGRKDSQVKIRGHRIELGEIQYHLKKAPAVKEARVFVQSNQAGDRFLCAYYIAGAQADKAPIREYLQQQLPAYMVPLHYVQIDEFPVTSNGKLDMAALPNPCAHQQEQERVQPRNLLEKQLADIWMETFQLKPGELSIHDNFFELGGHSIKAAVMISKINKKLRISLPLRSIFSAPTVAELALQCAGQPRTGFAEIRPAEKKQYYQTTSIQKQFFLVQKMYARSTAYNIPYVFEVKPGLTKEWLETIFNTLVRRHESLRTSFRLHRKTIVQVVHEPQPVIIETKAIIATDPAAYRQELAACVRAFVRPFRLSDPSLMRVGYFTGIRPVLVADIHHIVSDRASQDILMKEFLALLNQEALPAPGFQYKDIAEYRSMPAYLAQYRQMETYWLQKLQGELPEIDLSDKPRPATRSFAGASTHFVIGKEEAAWLRSLAASENTGMNALLLSIFSIVIAKVTGQPEVLIGFSMSGRNRPELVNVVGALVNTLVLHAFPQPEQTFIDYLRVVKEDMADAAANQEYAFDDLVDRLKVKREAGRNPLFEIIFDYNESPAPDAGEQVANAGVVANTSSKFDLYLQMDAGEQLHGSFRFATDVLDQETVEGYGRLFKAVIAGMMNNKHMNIGTITERQDDAPGTPQQEESLSREVLHHLFSQACVQHAASIAVYDKEQSFTYKELDARSEQVKHYLLQQLLQKGDTVAVLAHGSYPVLAVLLGIWKAGGVVLPVHPGTPLQRLEYMLDNAGCRYLVYEGQPPVSAKKDLLCIDAEDERSFAAALAGAAPVVGPEDLAYILYTSGSTGQPKGVMVRHRNIAHYISCAAGQYLHGERLNFALFTPLSFDLTMTALFTPLVSGASIVIFNDLITGSNLQAIFGHPLVGAIKCTPSHLGIIARLGAANENLKTLVVGGEAFDTHLADKIAALFPQAAIYNEYGPTETTVGCMIHRFRPQQETTATVPIGNSMEGYNVRVLDSYLMPVPDGGTGEICIGGAGVAAGYLGDEALTAQKFIEDPYLAGERLYLSGDLARVHPGNLVEYIGRRDEQIKLNGYRIEPEEIRRAMAELEGVTDSCVVVIETKPGEKALCAYYLAVAELPVESIKDLLAAKLPAYMVPALFRRLQEFPLTSNGKLDIKRLPDPLEAVVTDLFESADDTEQWLAEAWKQVLGRDEVPVNKSFFDTGGSSLRVLELCTILAERMEEPEEELILLVFKYPSIRDFAAYMRRKTVLPEEEGTAGERLNAGMDRFRLLRLQADAEKPGPGESVMI